MAQGPYVVCAAFCERTLEEKDNVMSLIRVIDRIKLTKAEPGEGPLSGATTLTSALRFVLILRSGDFKGPGKLRIGVQTPSGAELPGISLDVEMGGEDLGINVLAVGPPPVIEDGLYWYNIYFNDRFLTRTPLRLELVSSDQMMSKSSESQAPPRELKKKK